MHSNNYNSTYYQVSTIQACVNASAAVILFVGFDIISSTPNHEHLLPYCL